METIKFDTLVKIYTTYRSFWDSKAMKYVDNFWVSLFFYIFHSINVLSLHSRGYMEDYIIKKWYSSMNQFERVFDEKTFFNMSLTINNWKGWTWVDVHNHFLSISANTIFLSKRQSYKMLNIIKDREKSR